MALKKRLVKYLEKYLEEYKEEQIRDRLIEDGWNEENINSAIEIVKKRKNKKSLGPKEKSKKKQEKKAKKVNPTQLRKESKKGGKISKKEKSKKDAKKKVKPHETRRWEGIKHRSSALMVILSLITAGIFFVIWLAITTKELRKNSKTAPNPYWLFILLLPIITIVVALTSVNNLQSLSQLGENIWVGVLLVASFLIFGIIMLIYYWKYSSAINEISDFSSVGLFLLFAFTITAPVAQIISQMKLNAKAENKPKKKSKKKKENKKGKSEKKKEGKSEKELGKKKSKKKESKKKRKKQ